MEFIQKGLQNIADNNGYSLALSGMGIVFFALLFIAVIIQVLPYLLKVLDKIIPEKIEEPKVRVKSSPDSGAVIAVAIAGALKSSNVPVGPPNLNVALAVVLSVLTL